MSISVVAGDPRDARATQLLQASHALMQSLFPAESCHYLSIDALCAPNIRFYLAHMDGVAMGCCALAEKQGYGEVKSMFVDPAARGGGLADALLNRITLAALDAGLTALRLETGTTLHAAHRVYQRHGFAFCSPFGGYTAHPDSLFMAKSLG